ncbi:MAG: amino acid adenylation domain-containing protein [Phycisphaerales bacterium JB063]
MSRASSPIAFQLERAETSVPALFASAVDAGPDRLAIHSGGAGLTYRQLNADANRVAHALLARGTQPGDRVAILADQGPPLITAQLGVLKAGASFVPLDPTYPEQRNAYMLADAQAAALLTHTAHRPLAHTLSHDGPDPIETDTLDPALPTHNPDLGVDPGALAYVLYTSGSTGRPKGVMQPHRAVLHNAERHRTYFGITPDDRQSLLYPCSVYGGTRDIFNALLCGASLHHYPLRQLGHAGLAQWLREQRVTIYCSVVTVFRHFARGLQGPAPLPDVRLVKLGGEAPFASDIALFRQHFRQDCTLFCGLGSTEAGMARRFPIHRDTAIQGPGVPLGYAVEGVEVLLLDEQRRPVPTGAVGEIALRSRYLTLGYFGRDDLNAKKFLPTGDPDTRLLLTGDLGVMDDNGLLIHKGRNDHQVKIHGNRVELLEVEAVLATHPSVRDAVVVACPSDAGDQQLVAYIVFEPGQSPGVTAIRDYLRPHLPRFALPGIYVPLDAIPQTPNGKADRRALPDHHGRSLRPDNPYLEPHNEPQRIIATLFEQVLGVAGPGVLDSFFDLGGDSLSAVDLLLRLEKHFGQAPPLAAFYAQPTILDLANQYTGEDKPIDLDAAAIVRLNPHTQRPTLFAMAGKGGSVMCMRPLAQLLADRCVLGVQYPGVADGQPPHDDIPALAQVMARRIQKAQPTGPYRLMGYSFGGLVAYETARQLQHTGQPIAELIMLDTHVPGIRRRKSYLGRTRTHLRLAREHGGARYAWQKITGQQPARRPQQPQPVDGLPGPNTHAQDPPTVRFANALQQHARACERAARRYRPGTYTGPLTLVRSSQQPDWADFYHTPDDYGWSQHCQHPIQLLHTPAHHLQLFEHPHVTTLAQSLSPAPPPLPPAPTDTGKTANRRA